MIKQAGRPKKEDKKIHINITITPKQFEFLNTKSNKSEYIRALIDSEDNRTDKVSLLNILVYNVILLSKSKEKP